VRRETHVIGTKGKTDEYKMHFQAQQKGPHSETGEVISCSCLVVLFAQVPVLESIKEQAEKNQQVSLDEGREKAAEDHVIGVFT
jgi:hypothetical protein